MRVYLNFTNLPSVENDELRYKSTETFPNIKMCLAPLAPLVF